VQILDVTAADESAVEMGFGEVSGWDGSGCVVNVSVPELVDGRDYVAIAHAGTSSDFAAGDWLTTDQTYVSDHRAQVSLHRI